MIDNYGQVGAAARVGRWNGLVSLVTEKAVKEVSRYNEAISRAQADQLQHLKDAQEEHKKQKYAAHVCETNAEAREQAAAEQQKTVEAMDYLQQKSELESDIGDMALAAALINSGAQLAHRDYEYRYGKLFPKTEGQGYNEAQAEYASGPNWNSESLQAQQNHDQLLKIAQPALQDTNPDLLIPPPIAREQQLQKLRSIRDDMRGYYDQQLKPIWARVMHYWSDNAGGSV